MKRAVFCFTLMLCCVMLAASARAQTRPDVAAYQIPKNAKRLGPFSARDSRLTVYNYYAPGAVPSPQTLVGIESYRGDLLVERQLFKAGKKFGLQKSWYPNGQLQEEDPYYNDQMDGLFQRWNDKGSLIGHYVMVLGTGTRTIYHDGGEISEERRYVHSARNGLTMEYYLPEKVRSFTWLKDGEYVDRGFSFYEDDSLRSLSSFSSTGGLNGPYLEFDRAGKITNKQWFVHGKEVTEAEYAKAVAADKTLPPYYSDASQYTSFVGGDIKAQLKRYRELPKVKIPLEFDAQGNPAPAA